MSDELRAQRDLIDSILAISDEREEAYTQRDANPERWAKAKQEYADQRRFWREVAAYKRAVDEAARSVQAEPVVATGASVNPMGDPAPAEEG